MSLKNLFAGPDAFIKEMIEIDNQVQERIVRRQKIREREQRLWDMERLLTIHRREKALKRMLQDENMYAREFKTDLHSPRSFSFPEDPQEERFRETDEYFTLRRLHPGSR